MMNLRSLDDDTDIEKDILLCNPRSTITDNGPPVCIHVWNCIILFKTKITVT